MSDSDVEALQGEIMGWLDPGEQLVSCTSGTVGANSFGIVVAFISKYVRLGSAEGARNIALDDVRDIHWSALWARLNMRFESTGERLVFDVSRRNWKDRAKKLAAAWESRLQD